MAVLSLQQPCGPPKIQIFKSLFSIEHSTGVSPILPNGEIQNKM